MSTPAPDATRTQHDAPPGSLLPEATRTDSQTTRTPDFAPAPPADGWPTVPGYTIAAELGRGGMGVVYRAVQHTLNRDVALKMVLGAQTADEKMVIRFLAEAESIAAIKHPNVVAVYEFGDLDGRPFLALEYVSGGSLADRLRERAYDPHAAADLLAAVADGVQAAHDEGIVHRDLKPGNILLAGGTPKITDFGLAKKGLGSDLTRTQAVMGTPSYMAPEQARGDSKFVGPAADVWSLGVVLYETLARRKPFDADDAWATLKRVVDSAPTPLRDHVPNCPRDLDLIVMKCLEKEPHRRYPSAFAFAAELRRFRSGQTILARPAGRAERGYRWARRNPALAAVGGLLAASLVGLTAVSVVGYRSAVATAAQERHLREAETTARTDADAQKAAAEAATAAAVAATARATGEAARANQVSDFLAGMFMASDPINIFGDDIIPPSWEQQRAKTAETFLRDAAARFATELKDQPAARAKLLSAVGNSYRNLGLLKDAEPLLREAAALRAGTPEAAASAFDLGKLYLDAGDFLAARAQFGAAAAGIADEKDAVNARMFDGWAATMLQAPDAEALLAKVVADRERLYGPTHRQTVLARIGLVASLLDAGKSGDALKLLPKVMEGLSAQPETQIKALAAATVDFQTGVMFRGQANGNAFFLGRSEAALRSSLVKAGAALPDDHVYLAMIRFELGTTLDAAGQPGEAEKLFAQCHAAARKTVGMGHPKLLVFVDGYGELLAKREKVPAARALYDEVAAANLKQFGPANHWRGVLYLRWAEFEADFGDDAAAAAKAAEAVRLFETGKVLATREACRSGYGALKAVGNRPGKVCGPATLALAEVCRKLEAAAGGEGVGRILVTATDRLFRQGQYAAAAKTLAEAEAEVGRMPPTVKGDLAHAKGKFAAARGEWAKAEPEFRAALAASRATGDLSDIQNDATQLAAVFLELGRPAEAVPLMAEAKRAALNRPTLKPFPQARASFAAAAAAAAAGDSAAYRGEIADAENRFGKSQEVNPYGEFLRAAVVSPGSGIDCAAHAQKFAKLLQPYPNARLGYRTLALLELRGGKPASVLPLLTKTPGPIQPADHLVYGLSLVAEGKPDAARAQLWKADAARSALTPTGVEFPFAEGNYLDRLEERLLRRELAAQVPAGERSRAPFPRPSRSPGD